jgi:MtN3 and saliva related transmembrane protein
MQDIDSNLIGTIAAFCTTVSFVPQALQVYRTKNTDAISLSMYLIFNIGILLWLVYGILIQSAPIIYSNLITFVFACYILIIKIANLPKK